MAATVVKFTMAVILDLAHAPAGECFLVMPLKRFSIFVPLLLLLGCGRENEAPPAPPPPEVRVVTVQA